MKIELKKQIVVEACKSLLDVGIPRDEYLAFLPALMLGEEGEITPAIVNERLFFTEANDPRGRLLLERLEAYRLVEYSEPKPSVNYGGFLGFFAKQETRAEDEVIVTGSKSYILTETGKAAIRDRTIFIPERDVFILHGTDDPLFSEPILACKKANESSSRPNTKSKGNKKDKSSRNGLWLKELKERVEQEPRIIYPAAEKNGAVQIIKVEHEEEWVDPVYSVSVTLTINDDESTILTLHPQQDLTKKSGSMKGHIVGHEFTFSFIDVLKNLFSDRSVDVVETVDGCALRVSFDEIAKDTAAQKNHTKNFDIKQPEIKGFGTFNDVTVRALPVIPRIMDDAEEWAAWTLRESIRYYTNEARYMELREKAAKMWEPVYSYDQILESLPSFHEIRREREMERTKNPEDYWFVTAPSLLTIKEGE